MGGSVLSGVAVAFVTDIEGMWDRLVDFAAGNPLLSIDVLTGQLEVTPGNVLVFGGDAVDRGPWGRRVVRTLLEARRRTPDRVILLAGNRDINKLRLPRELSGHPPARTPPEVAAGDRVTLLRWIMANTMGARDAFEFRRTELAIERKAAVTDDDVVQSFLADSVPGGELAEYIAECQLAYRAGDTLFLHGGVTEESLGVVPGQRERAADVDLWCQQLNRWYAGQVAAYQAGGPDDADGKPPWWPLIAYQAPLPGSRQNPTSVVYGRTADGLQNPELPPPAVIAQLTGQGVRRVMVGHTPIGDSPAPVRDAGFELVFADNSHARIPVASQISIDGGVLSVRARSKLDDGRVLPVAFQLDIADGGSPIGRRRADSGHLVIGQLEGGDYLEFKYFEDYRVEQRAVSPAELAKVRLEPPYHAA
jgi:Calcineurin-like phosphoesterase